VHSTGLTQRERLAKGRQNLLYVSVRPTWLTCPDTAIDIPLEPAVSRFELSELPILPQTAPFVCHGELTNEFKFWVFFLSDPAMVRVGNPLDRV
jgi:hypothetical protein